MSDTGKPIFSRYGSGEEIAKICGLFQAIRSSINSDISLGDIRSLRNGSLCLVFMAVGSVTLVAIGSESDSEAYLKLQLEYIFGQIIFTVTEKIQEYYQFNPSFDLRTILGNSDSLINDILKEAAPNGNPGPFLLGGIESLFPISQTIRARASSTLQSVGMKTDFTIFALLVVGEKILSLVQPVFPAHQMKLPDLRLLLKFINRQPGLLSSELWIPACLPRFSSRDFLFCYTQCLDSESKLCLIFVSQQSTTEQFTLFRMAAADIRCALDLPPLSQTVLEILEPTESHNEDTAHNTSARDVKWRRSDDDLLESDDDYVDASGEADRMIPYVARNSDEHPLLNEVKAATDVKHLKRILSGYLEIGSALHFLFRIDVPLQAAARNGTPGGITQCISPPLVFPLADDKSKHQVWSTYEKLGLRLRLGSATAESMMDAFDMITQDHVETSVKDEGLMPPGIGRYCPAMALAEAPANLDGIAYVKEGTELFFAMNGPDFEM